MWKRLICIFCFVLSVFTQESIFCEEELEFYVRTQLQSNYLTLERLKNEVEILSNELHSLTIQLRDDYVLTDGANSSSLNTTEDSNEIIKQVATSNIYVSPTGEVEYTQEQKDLLQIMQKKRYLDIKRKEVMKYEEELHQRENVIKYSLLNYN